MELLQLRYFQKVAELESMTKAAKALYIAQPSLSKTISRLEGQVGVPLFDRKGKRIKLNRYGECFLYHVEKALNELDSGIRQVQDMTDKKEKSVSVGSATAKLLPDLITSFMMEDPGTKLRFFQVTQHGELLRQLENGEIDISISSLPLRAESIICEKLIQERIYLVVSPESRLAEETEVTIREIESEPLIYFTAECGLREIINQICEQAEFIPNITCECTTSEVTCSLVKAGLGSAFLPEYLSGTEYAKDLVWIPIGDPEMERTIWISRNRERYMSEAAYGFWDFTFKYFAEEGKKV